MKKTTNPIESSPKPLEKIVLATHNSSTEKFPKDKLLTLLIIAIIFISVLAIIPKIMLNTPTGYLIYNLQTENKDNTILTVTSKEEHTIKQPTDKGIYSIKIDGTITGEGAARAYIILPDNTELSVLNRKATARKAEDSGYAKTESQDNPPPGTTRDHDLAISDKEPVPAEQTGEEKSIDISLAYQSGTRWDANDDGIAATEADAVDFTVSETKFSWDVEASKLCTRWTITSQDTGSSTTLCNGNAECCGLVGVAHKEETWDAPLYIYYEQYGTTASNTVSAQVIYLDQSLEPGNTHFDSAQSKEMKSTADFAPPTETEFKNACEDTCNLIEPLNLTEYTIIFEVDQGTVLKITDIILESDEPEDTEITTNTTQLQAIVGLPVKWKKVITAEDITESINTTIPAGATNITVNFKTAPQQEYTEVEKDNIAITDESDENKMPPVRTIGVSEDEQTKNPKDNVTISIEQEFTQIEIEYETPAPTLEETETGRVKEIVIKSEYHYTDVLSSTKLAKEVDEYREVTLKWIIQSEQDAETLNLSEEERTQIIDGRHAEINLDFNLSDTDGNGKYDTITWTAPHLSNQTFQIILISKAERLDENRTSISDVYEAVKERDNHSTLIQGGEYIRVMFEKNLTNVNDITIYAHADQNTTIEVYEKDSNTPIAEFTGVSEDKKYRILLTSLNGSQDTFDLRPADDVWFDHVIDPPANDSANNIYQCGTIDSPGHYIFNKTITPTGTAPCLNITTSNVTVDCNGYKILNTSYTGTAIINVANKVNITIKNCNITKSTGAAIAYAVARRENQKQKLQR